MRKAAAVLSAFLVAGFLSATAADWKKIARETDEPAFGQRIVHILPDSQAERIGLKVGDYVVQVDEQQVRGFGMRNFDVERAFFYVRKGGEADYTTVESGKVGYIMEEVFRPWIAYLRGEIGTPSEKWEDDVTTVLLQMHENPEAAGEGWKKVREAGYPADELDAFIAAYLAWRKGEPIPVREAFDRVFEEFEVMPALYFAKLEDMATAAGQTDVLRNLKDIDPESSNVSDRLASVWDKIDYEDKAPKNFLEMAEARRGKEITADLEKYETEKTSIRPMTSNPLECKVMSATPGHYQFYRGEVPEGIRNLHCRFRLHASSTGFHDRWSSRMRLDLYAADKEEWDEYGSSLLGRIGVGEDRHAGSYIYAEGGHRGYRKFGDVGIVNGITKGVVKETVREVDFDAPPYQLDLIYLDQHIAIYFNGVCYLNLPCGEGINDLALGLHVCGMTAYPESFQVWELNPE
ncbi:MAG: hypothetical protein MI807_14785 [Verrucomicrobiales bacterium]|nr:hypothetical protein [Verrucomicrobiales bacterium]